MGSAKSPFGCSAVLLLMIVLCGGAFFLSPIGRTILLLVMRPHMTVREGVTIPLPDGIHEIEHSRIGTHPLVAEYDRDVTFLANGVRGQTKPLAVDTCGGYPINCYLVETGRGVFVRLADPLCEHLLDPREQTVRVVRGNWRDSVPTAGPTDNVKQRYLGTIAGGFGSLRFIPASEQAEQPLTLPPSDTRPRGP